MNLKDDNNFEVEIEVKDGQIVVDAWTDYYYSCTTTMNKDEALSLASLLFAYWSGK